MVDKLVALLAATGYAGIFFAMMLESAAVPVPSEVVLPFAGILVSQGQMTFWAAVGWTVAGQLTGSLIAYAVGTYGGRPFLERYGKYALIRHQELDRAERWFARYGEVTAFTTRLLPGARTFISVPAGAARMNLGRFLGYSLLGILPWTMLLVWAGEKLGPIWDKPLWHGCFRGVEVLVVVAFVGLVVRWYVLKRRSARQGGGS